MKKDLIFIAIIVERLEKVLAFSVTINAVIEVIM